MNWHQVWVVYTKELRDALRDRRTLFSMIVVPAFIMPAIMFVFGSISLRVVKKAHAEIPAVMLIGGESAPELKAAFQNSKKLNLVPPASDYAGRISNKTLRAAVEIPPGFEASLGADEMRTIKIYHYSGELKSGIAADEIDRILRDYRESIVHRKLTEKNLPSSFVRPFEFQRQNVAPPEKVGGNLFGGMIPYMLILLSFVGAMYPAIDLTAGEKERGTMETILCSPVGRVELVLGKFLTVVTVSLSTTVMSVISLGVSGLGMVAMFQDKVMAGAKAASAAGKAMPMIDPLGVLGVFVMVIPLAVMFAAIIFTVSLFAKSHKEAQTYVSPMMIFIIMPAVSAMLPGVELSKAMTFVPILNVSLLSKEMVSGSFPLGTMALIFLSSCVYGALALALAVYMFKRESVLFRT